MPKIDLLPCPFCGEKAETFPLDKCDSYGNHERLWYSECGKCFARSGYYNTDGEAVIAWNTRASGWIPCSVKKPEAYKSVLVVIKDNDRYTWINIGETDEDGNWMIGGEFWYSKSDTSITHWMPTPELPKEVQHDEN